MKRSIVFRILLSLFCLGWTNLTLSQVWDDFSDGDFTIGTQWTGDTSQFQVSAGWLQLNSSGNDSSFIVTSRIQNHDTIEWRFKLKLGFSPSSQNYARYYLCSDSASLEGPLSGYFLQFGESGAADAVRLYKQSGFAIALLASGPDSMIATSFDIGIKVLLFPGGRWELWCDYSGGSAFSLQSVTIDNTIQPGLFTGLKCVYTSSNSAGFYLDDVYNGSFFYDTLPPEITEISISGDSLIRLIFNEETDSSTVFNVQHFHIRNVGYPALVTRDTAAMHAFSLHFSQTAFGSIPYQLIMTGIADINGNVRQDSVEITFFKTSATEVSDLVISEIMADPSSAPALPPYEYIEVFNRSQKVLVTTGFSIGDPGTIAILPSDTLFPGDFRAYTESTAVVYFQQLGYQNIRGISNMPSLNNDGDKLKLMDAKGKCLDMIQYDKTMYRDPLRDDQGWSLERKDVYYPCSDTENWLASHDPSGGTPGIQNSITAVFTDTISPYPVYAWPEDSLTVKIYFSECIDTVQARSVSLYSIDNAVGSPQVVEASSDELCIWMKLNTPLQRGIQYRLFLSDSIRDCSGNKLSRWNFISIALPDTFQRGDVILNEILFNPREDGSDFIEIYNASHKTINLAEIRIAHADPLTGIADDLVPFSAENRLIFPGSYAVAATSPVDIRKRYSTADRRTLVACELPSFNDEEGVVVLLNAALSEMERFYYKDNFHFPLLYDPEGVSLERVSPILYVNDSSNWHSASESVGYATPGALNSQFYNYSNLKEEWLNLSPPLFSPDNDGYHDVLGISCTPSHPGYVVSLSVYDEFGHIVRKLSRHELIGSEGHWLWDGLADSGETLNAGIYIVILEMFHIDGDTRIIKKATVLAKRQ